MFKPEKMKRICFFNWQGHSEQDNLLSGRSPIMHCARKEAISWTAWKNKSGV